RRWAGGSLRHTSHVAMASAQGVGRNLRKRPAMAGSWHIVTVAALPRLDLRRRWKCGRRSRRSLLARRIMAGRASVDVILVAVATTTLRPGTGPIATPREVTGAERRRGINATPTTAIASRSAATARSFRLMPLPSPADNIPTGSIGRKGASLENEEAAAEQL